MGLCCTLQAPTWVFGQILYLCVFSFAHLPADVVRAAVLPPLLRKLPKRGPGQEHGWLCSRPRHQRVFNVSTLAARCL